MNRMRLPRQHRRYSLPSISHKPLGVCRAVPEGSDTFQKALEELYISEPNHAPTPTNTVSTLNGLSNIQEGDEEDCAQQEEELDPIAEIRRLNRRHSSPSFFSKDDIDGLPDTDVKSNDKLQTGTAVKKQTNASKEYFIKHGHWPEVKSSYARPFSIKQNVTRGTSVAFGSSSVTKQSKLKT